MNIFTSVIDPGLDLDLLPLWIAHYKAYKYDRYVIFVHCKPTNIMAVLQASKWLEEAGWEYNRIDDTTVGERSRIVYGSYQNGLMQKFCIDDFKESLNPEDILITADSDEFHDLEPMTANVLLSYCDWIGGYLLDQWGDTLHDACPEISLHVQYPHQGSMIGTLVKNAIDFDIEKKDSPSFQCIQRKILAAKVRLPVNYQGMHGFSDCDGSLSDVFRAGDDKQQHLPHYDDVDVLHYSWRRTALQRMDTKSYYPEWLTEALIRKFGITGPELAAHRERQNVIREEKRHRFATIARMM